MFKKAVWLIGAVALVFFMSFSCFALDAGSNEPAPKDVLILSNTTCCVNLAWPAEEIALLEELKTIGLDVQIFQWTPPAASPEELSENFFNNELKAAITNAGEENNVKVVVYLQRTPEGDYRADVLRISSGEVAESAQLNFVEQNHPDVIQTAALQIVETVAVLISHIDAVPAPAKPEEPPIANEPPPIKRKPQIGIGMGMATVYSPGGVPPSLGIDGTLRVSVATHFSLQLDFLWAFYGKNISSNGESASFDLSSLRGGLYWNILPDKKIHPALGVFGGVLVARSQGLSDADTGIENVKVKQAVPYFGAAGRVAFDIFSHTAFVLSVRGGLLTSQIDIVLNNHKAATFGMPLLEFMGGFEFRFL